MIPLGLPVLSLSISFFSNSDQRLLFTVPRTDWPNLFTIGYSPGAQEALPVTLSGLVLLYCNLISIPFHRTDQLIYRRSLRLAVLLYFWKSNSANAPYLQTIANLRSMSAPPFISGLSLMPQVCICGIRLQVTNGTRFIVSRPTVSLQITRLAFHMKVIGLRLRFYASAYYQSY